MNNHSSTPSLFPFPDSGQSPYNRRPAWLYNIERLWHHVGHTATQWIQGENMATINDIVLIYMEDSPLTFARVEAIEPDIKPGWYHIKLLMLQVPLQVVSWILRDAYIEGESFSMGGKQMRMEKVICPEEEVSTDEKAPKKEDPDHPAEKAEVISLADLKKK